MLAAISALLALFRDGRVSRRSKLLFVAMTVLYLLVPFDFIPDFLLPFGVIDDVGAILALAAFFRQHARGQIEAHDADKAAEREELLAASVPVPAALTDGGASAQPQPTQPTIVVRSNTTNYGCLAFVGLVFAAPLIGLLLLFLSGHAAFSDFFNGIADIFNTQTRANTFSSRVLVDSVYELGQLVTERSEVVLPSVRVSVHEGIFGSGYFSANHRVIASVEAGVDITDMDEESFRVEPMGSTLIVSLPAPMITSCNVEFIDQYDYSISLGQKDWDAVRQIAEYQALIEFRQHALESGLLDRAKGSISERLGTIFHLLTDFTVHIEYAADPPEPRFGASCYPFPPDGWQIDAATGEWTRES